MTRVGYCSIVIVIFSWTHAHGEWHLLTGYDTGQTQQPGSQRYRIHGGGLGLFWTNKNWRVGATSRFVRYALQSKTTPKQAGHYGSDSTITIGHARSWWALVAGVNARYTDSTLTWQPAGAAIFGPSDLLWLECAYHDRYTPLPSSMRLGLGARLAAARLFAGWVNDADGRGLGVYIEIPIEGPIDFSISSILNPQSPSDYIVIGSSLAIRWGPKVEGLSNHR